MSKQMLIDASQPEETRVAVLDNGELVEYQHEISAKLPIKGNIYLAKVIRVEPSLQAAFVDYGESRHGFLGFNDIHPDYYKIPVEDKKEILANSLGKSEEDLDEMDDDAVSDFDLASTLGAKRFRLKRHYKIQEVIKRGQVMLVQAVKEERGNKGAAMTTFISLAGRYCVLMPNSGRGGGISRRISDDEDRKRLKKIVGDLKIDDPMALILRTAGAGRTKSEIKRDYDYLIQLWADIRKLTLDSQAPALVHEDANILWQAIRDIYDKDTDKIIIAGEESYQKAREYMKHLVPTHVRRIAQYDKNGAVPIFQKHQVETLINSIYWPNVSLPSGGYIVIEQTEALVSIDVNSGRATQERHIEETAINTNMEAASEVARQMRLRDLSGLIVIDFIDMEDRKNNSQLERHFKEALKKDRARMQVNRLSSLGLLEMTRQRLNPSLSEVTSSTCPHCYGTGKMLNVSATALMMMRTIEDEAGKGKGRIAVLCAKMSLDMAIYLFNAKRQNLQEIETANQMHIVIDPDPSMPMAAMKLYCTSIIEDDEIIELAEDKHEEVFNNYDRPRPSGSRSRRGRGRSRGGRRQQRRSVGADDDARSTNGAEFDAEPQASDTRADTAGRRRRGGGKPRRNGGGDTKKGVLWRIIG